MDASGSLNMSLTFSEFEVSPVMIYCDFRLHVDVVSILVFHVKWVQIMPPFLPVSFVWLMFEFESKFDGLMV